MLRFLRGAVLVAACMAPVTLTAHIFPISFGTLVLAKNNARLRLRISVHNLHPALEAFTASHMEMKDDGYGLPLLDAYFKGRLELVSPKGKVTRFRVLDQAIGIEEIVFTLEAPLRNSKGWQIRNAVLFEQSQDQKNYLTVELGSRRLGLTFDTQHPLLPLSAP